MTNTEDRRNERRGSAGAIERERKRFPKKRRGKGVPRREIARTRNRGEEQKRWRIFHKLKKKTTTLHSARKKREREGVKAEKRKQVVKKIEAPEGRF